MCRRCFYQIYMPLKDKKPKTVLHSFTEIGNESKHILQWPYAIIIR